MWSNAAQANKESLWRLKLIQIKNLCNRVSLDFSSFPLLLLDRLRGFSPLNEAVDHDDKRRWCNDAEAWEVEGIAVVIRLVHQPACTRNTEE